MPPATDVPDDRVRGDDVEQATAPSAPSPASGPYAPPRWAPPGEERPDGPPHVRGRRRGGSRRGWLVVAGVGAVMLISSTGAMSSSATDSQKRDFSGDTIVVQAGANEVEVVGGAEPGKIEITRRSHWGLGASRPRPAEEWGEGRLEIRDADCGGFAWRCSIDYVMRVPDGTAVSIDSGSGDISVGGALGTLDLNAGSGDIDGRRLSAEHVVAKTGSGDIDLGFASGSPEVVAKAGSGSIDLELATAPGALDVETGSGDVGIDVPERQQYQLDIETGSGDQNVDLPSTANADSRIRVRTGSGDVELE